MEVGLHHAPRSDKEVMGLHTLHLVAQSIVSVFVLEHPGLLLELLWQVSAVVTANIFTWAVPECFSEADVA